jgi:putative ABC transport system ATP-binding protein
MLSCKDLTLIYKDGAQSKTVLDQVDLEIKRGESAVLLGPSGSGKSSLIYLLSCLRKPTGGDVFLDGVRISGQNQKDIADTRKNRFAFVFQMHFLLPYLTASENVMAGCGDFSKNGKRQAAELLERLGLEGHINKRIHQMSGGERQRVAIARALIGNPDVIFADEPTASLDHETAQKVFEILKSHKPDSTLVLATHDTSILSGNERIIKIENAKAIG